MLVSHVKFELIANMLISMLKYISLWGVLLGSLASCKPSQISIAQISTRKVGKTVYLKGEVVHLAPLVDTSAYQIEDFTGRAWVVTTKVAPQIGQKINIKGKIEYQSLPFAERELGDFYIVELEQLESSISE